MRLQFAEPRNVIQRNNGCRKRNGGATVCVWAAEGLHRVQSEEVPQLCCPALQGGETAHATRSRSYRREVMLLWPNSVILHLPLKLLYLTFLFFFKVGHLLKCKVGSCSNQLYTHKKTNDFPMRFSGIRSTGPDTLWQSLMWKRLKVPVFIWSDFI